MRIKNREEARGVSSLLFVCWVGGDPQSRQSRYSSPYIREPLRTGVADCHGQCAH